MITGNKNGKKPRGTCQCGKVQLIDSKGPLARVEVTLILLDSHNEDFLVLANGSPSHTVSDKYQIVVSEDIIVLYLRLLVTQLFIQISHSTCLV